MIKKSIRNEKILDADLREERILGGNDLGHLSRINHDIP
jgi:hypothetical protein